MEQLSQVVHLNFQGTPKILDRGDVETMSDLVPSVGQSRLFYDAFKSSRSILEFWVDTNHRLEDEIFVVGFLDTIDDD